MAYMEIEAHQEDTGHEKHLIGPPKFWMSP
jgi:hypothetical protein